MIYLISTLSGWWLGLVSRQLPPDFQSGTLLLSYRAIHQSSSSCSEYPTNMSALMVFMSGHQPSPHQPYEFLTLEHVYSLIFVTEVRYFGFYLSGLCGRIRTCVVSTPNRVTNQTSLHRDGWTGWIRTTDVRVKV